ncbi:MAG: NADH-quinone oxidoreductase subunit K [Kiritimatiellia bacterium]|jgi:NADH-quinone oxidoreductase subunit K
MIDLRIVLTFAAVLFCLGIYGVISRKNAIGMLVSIEIMANAVNMNMLAFAWTTTGVAGHAFVLFSIALTVAEVVMGLALVVLLYRRWRDVSLDLASEMKR